MNLKKIPHKLITICLCCCVFTILSTIANAAIAITDQAGQKITAEQPFKRIISLYPAHTENLFSLGLNEEIIGVSKNDDYPPQTVGKTKFHYREDPEKFIAAQPDLVLIRPMIARAYPDFIKKLEMVNITVVSLQPRSISETFEYWRTLGILTGREQQAEEMVRHFKQKLATIKQKIDLIPIKQRKTVYFEAIHKKMKTFAPQSTAIFTLTSAGGINAAADASSLRRTNIAAYGKEQILAKSAQIDVFLAQQGKMNSIILNDIYAEPGFKAIKAVQNKEVYLINEALVSRPTLRLLDGIKLISQILYPSAPDNQ